MRRVAALLLLALAPGEAVAATNLIVIVIDALRADHLSSYGYARPTSPKLDAFAARAVRFTRAMAPSNRTCSSMPSIWTGLLPSRHGVLDRRDVLAERFATAAELLRARGYRTGAWCPNPSLDRAFGLAQGWDVYETDFEAAAGGERTWQAHETASVINARALAFVDATRERPFLLWLHYRDVHGPYLPPPPYDTVFHAPAPRPLSPAEVRARPGYLTLPGDADDLEYYVARYDGGIRYTDERVAQLLAELGRRGVLERSVVVVTADHGEAFLEHRQWNHGVSLYEEEVHVPLIIARPGDAPRVVDHVVSTLDLFPTLLELAGATPPETDGESLVPLLAGQAAAYRRRRAAAEARVLGDEHRRLQRAIREHDWKLLDNGFTPKPRLFDLASDPQERHDRSADEPERAAALAGEMRALAARAAGAPPAEAKSLGGSLKRRLEALGYVD
ncbi:MAG TPA: sulfatase [Candidatus Binatia bacterium]|nr:sulfatase [Candidatus Binatia bacterium]